MKKIFSVIILTFFCFITIFAQNKDTVTTESGLKYIVQEKGNGEHAEPGKDVEVHYTGYLTNGKVFDSSRERGEPIEFVLGEGKVIPGWEEGIALMNVGDKYRLIIPPKLAYGEKGAGNVIPPKATLIFDVELMNVGIPKLSLSDTLLMAIFTNGVDSAVTRYYQIKENESEKYNMKESQLNTLGYELLQSGLSEQAIKILKLNVEAYPESANVYDSLAEAYLMDGKKEDAIKNYEKSLELNPDNGNAKEKLEKIKEEK